MFHKKQIIGYSPFLALLLFKLVSAGFDGVTLKILEEWVMSADERQLEAAAKLLHEANPSFVWENQQFVIIYWIRPRSTVVLVINGSVDRSIPPSSRANDSVPWATFPTRY